ncbi:MAG: DPP IV N-terminal domain-containing protein [Pyrinomonadaceae bacterium]|nr:DPP IV N-terminal domain-containing protein [Pyrinomonadaceae bacterium]
MMKKYVLLFVAVIAAATPVIAQEKLLSVDAIFSPDPKVRVNFNGTPSRLAWAADGRSFRSYQDGKLVRVDAISGQTTQFFDSSRLAAALMAVAGLTAEDAARIANSATLQFNQSETAILLNHNNDLWHYDLAAGMLKRLTNTKDEEKEADYSPDGRWVSFVRNNDLFVVEVARAREKQLTRDGSERVHNGYLVWVYEEELYGRGQNRGYWWSPDSQRIAFLRLDDSPVPRFVLTNDVTNTQIIEDTRYPKAGDPNPLVELGIANVTGTSRVPNVGRIPGVGGRLPAGARRFGDLVQFVDLDAYKPEDRLIGRVAWSPDAKTVVFQGQNREQTFLDVNAAALNGKVKKLLTETSPAWVGINDNPYFLKDGSWIWQSERDGWSHLYHYAADGTLIRRLTEGKWEVRSVYGVDETAGYVYFSGTRESHIAENVYRVAINGGEVQRLTEGEGNHSASFNRQFTHYVHNWSDINTPPQQRLFRADGRLERVINENRVAALAEYNLPRPEFLRVKTRDGFEMEAVMIRPPNFDATKKYPVLQYTYAGPHAPQVRNAWGGNRYLWHQMLAQKGYIIWICDNRTASGKGAESTWPVYKNFGPLELRDIEDGVNYLKSLQFVDPDRIGIWGWSYGGFMTSFAMTHSKAFKMGIAGGSVTDWHLYDSIYTERYMATPQNNRAGYERTSVTKAAKDLSGNILLIHGVMDDNVHMQNTIQLANELQKHGKQFELMLYPTQRHGVTNPAQAHHMYTMMTRFIERNL